MKSMTILTVLGGSGTGSKGPVKGSSVTNGCCAACRGESRQPKMNNTDKMGLELIDSGYKIQATMS